MEGNRVAFVIFACILLLHQVVVMPAHTIRTTKATSSNKRSPTTSALRALDNIFWKIVQRMRNTDTTLCNPECRQKLLVKHFKEIEQRTEIPMYTKKSLN